MPDSSRDLADLRAALAVTLRMVQRVPGPAGLTVLSVPSDRELIDEVRRIRELLDRAGSGERQAVPRPQVGPGASCSAVWAVDEDGEPDELRATSPQPGDRLLR